MFSSKKKARFASLVILLSLSSSFAFAKDTSLDRFRSTINLLNTEEDLSKVSQKMERLADELEKKGNVAKAKSVRLAAHPESLAMTRAYLRSELEKKDVNGLYLNFAERGLCEPIYSSTGYGVQPDVFLSSGFCLLDIVMTIITLGNNHGSVQESL